MKFDWSLVEFKSWGRKTALFLAPWAAGLVWLGVSLLVAYPAEASNLDLGALATKFLSDWNRFFLWLLLGADIVIAVGFLGDESVSKRLSGRGLWIAVLAIAVFSTLTTLLPSFNPKAQAWSTSILLAGLACLLVVRSQSYAARVVYGKV